jgi:hypothetical protein
MSEGEPKWKWGAIIFILSAPIAMIGLACLIELLKQMVEK